VLADAFFTGDSLNSRVIRADGLRIPDVLDGILALINLDSYMELRLYPPLQLMRPKGSLPPEHRYRGELPKIGIRPTIMVGNPDLKRKGLYEEALGHNAILAGFQGQRHWTDHFPNGDFLETILNSSFDWNGIRSPYLDATLWRYADLAHHLVCTAAYRSGTQQGVPPQLLERLWYGQ